MARSEVPAANLGLGCYEGADAQLIRDPAGAGLVPGFIDGSTQACGLLLACQGKAADQPGAVAHAGGLANCQPFTRELMGVVHLFAMQGELQGLGDSRAFPTGVYTPIGDTSAERAFCVLMSRLRVLWQEDTPLPEVRLAVVSDFAARLRPLGLANFIYADSELLFVHGHQQADDPERPGLFLAHSDGGVRVASQPLDTADWQGLEPGEVLMIKGAEVLERCAPFKLWSQLSD
uniref:class II glutamine amidotransferase n=1 Tax=Marinobacterium profundum TaxID=1714300 RepID=UPI001315620B|nr:class II glutamine amidotransferase [Marinobacterium profundum]